MPRALILLLLAALLSPALAADARPNIIVILCDDMGFSDIGCYGGEILTPNLDALAAGGLRFTQFYNTARCCPTRASLLTGLYPHQTGIGHMVDAWSKRSGEGYAGDLNNRCLTLAQVLRAAGYRTMMTGKWHLTPSQPKDGKPDTSGGHNWPLQRGFERFYGTIHGAGSFYDPNTLVRDNTLISPYADPQYKPDSYYYTDAITDHSVRYIKEADAASPFFLYVAYTAAHWPMHAKDSDIAKYKGKYDAGYTAIRKARYERLVKMGLIDPQWAMSPADATRDSVKDAEFEARCMEVYAAMVDCMDQGVGKIVDALKEKNQLDNTLILWMQDNGGCAETLGRAGEGKPRASAPSLPPMKPADLQPDMIPKQTRDGYPVRQGYGVMPGGADTYIAYGKGWANVSNTPFREYKHWVHEGGISTPLIAHWPKGLARKGQLEQTPAHLIDIAATCYDLASAKYPVEYNGNKITPLEGRSLAPLFTGGKIQRDAIYWEHEGNRAVRVGDWKLVAKGRKGAWELYDMARDRTELHDLAAANPAKVAELAKLWEEYATRTHVLPWPPQEEPKKKTNAKKKK